MNVQDCIKNSIQTLDKNNIATAHLDAELIVSFVTKQDKVWIHAHPEYKLSSSELTEIQNLCNRRSLHEPMAYILGKQEFYGRDFFVTPDTLTPRPETESMIDLLLSQVEILRSKVENINIIDVGTGSGCIVITAALEISKFELRNTRIEYFGLDISRPALKIAHENAKIHKVDINFKKYDLTKNTFDLQESSFNIFLANLPYVPNNFNINLAATHEPSFAIFGGDDGLDYYRLLFDKIPKINSLVITESLPFQHTELSKIARKNDFKLLNSSGFIQVFSSK